MDKLIFFSPRTNLYAYQGAGNPYDAPLTIGEIANVVNEKYSPRGICLEVFERLYTYEDTGLTPAEVAEYAKAKAGGRAVLLPCKVGDTVEATVLRPYNGHTFTIHGKVCDIQPVVRVVSEHCRPVDFLASDFGKTAFLVPKDAEKALNTKTRTCPNCEYWLEKYEECEHPDCPQDNAGGYMAAAQHSCEFWEPNC